MNDPTTSRFFSKHLHQVWNDEKCMQREMMKGKSGQEIARIRAEHLQLEREYHAILFNLPDIKTKSNHYPEKFLDASEGY